MFQYTNAVSTHSRLKAAEERQRHHSSSDNVSTHSRLKAAGQQIYRLCRFKPVSTHSRLKAADVLEAAYDLVKEFQHTAA